MSHLPSTVILVTGVSGSGKTTIGKLLAADLGWPFSDADDFHSSDNVDKMRRGIPLTESDRAPWLQTLQLAIQQRLWDNQNWVLACSALKASYRQQLIVDRSRIKLVYLTGSHDLIQQRLQARLNHYMSAKLLDSQFEILEKPSDAICVEISAPPPVIVQQIRAALE